MTRKSTFCGFSLGLLAVQADRWMLYRPQVVGQLDIDNTLDPHNAFVVRFRPATRFFPNPADTVIQIDEMTQYIDWAVENKFAVMDINVPSYEENDNVSGSGITAWGVGVSDL